MAKTKVISDLFSPIEISMEFMTVLFANESDEKFPVNCNDHYWPKSRASKLK